MTHQHAYASVGAGGALPPPCDRINATESQRKATVMFTRAITRRPGEDLAAGLTNSRLGPPSYETAKKQHDRYIETLAFLGLDVIVLEPLPGYPDAYFVEDTAVVAPDVAVITIPGAQSRRGETKEIEPVLAEYRRIEHIRPPGLLDGGDVLMVGTHFLIGISGRTNAEGAAQLGAILEEHGHTWTMVPVLRGLHLRSNVGFVGADVLLVNEDHARLDALKRYEKIVVDNAELYAANTLLVNTRLIMPAGFPKTRRMIEATGLEIIELDISEMRKMDGGLSCMSLRF
jgi:dimethylargininase